MSNPPPPNSNSNKKRRNRRRRPRSTPPSQAPTQTAKPQKSGSALGAIVVFIFRFLMVGASLGVGFLGGIVLAQNQPQANPQKPLVERWRSQLSQELDPDETPTDEPTPTPEPQARSPLQNEFEQLNQEVAQLNQQIQNFRVGDDTNVANQKQQLQQQIQAVSQRLEQIQPLVEPTPTPITPTSTAPGQPLRLTLPSDVLFSEAGEELTRNSRSILDSLIAELENYPEANVYIAGYTDGGDNPTTRLERSFEQAKQVEDYLKDNLDDARRWISIGYGASRFAAPNDTPANRQRNRRIEIRVEPRR